MWRQLVISRQISSWDLPASLSPCVRSARATAGTCICLARARKANVRTRVISESKLITLYYQLGFLILTKKRSRLLINLLLTYPKQGTLPSSRAQGSWTGHHTAKTLQLLKPAVAPVLAQQGTQVITAQLWLHARQLKQPTTVCLG